jgi:hypothetical protein
LSRLKGGPKKPRKKRYTGASAKKKIKEYKKMQKVY